MLSWCLLFVANDQSNGLWVGSVMCKCWVKCLFFISLVFFFSEDHASSWIIYKTTPKLVILILRNKIIFEKFIYLFYFFRIRNTLTNLHSYTITVVDCYLPINLPLPVSRPQKQQMLKWQSFCRITIWILYQMLNFIM